MAVTHINMFVLRYENGWPLHRHATSTSKSGHLVQEYEAQEGVGGIEGLHTPLSPRIEPCSDERSIEVCLEWCILTQVLHPCWH